MKGKRNTRKVTVLVLATLITLLGGTALTGSAAPAAQDGTVAVIITTTQITWQPLVENGGTALSISGPDYYLQKEYGAGARPTLKSTDNAGNPLPDGAYTYELQLLPINNGDTQPTIDDAERGLAPVQGKEPLVYGGAFAIVGGEFATPTTEEGGEEVIDAARPRSPIDGATADQCIYDDLIVDGSECVGNDCTCNMAFGFDTIVLKENNLRIFFDDTSTIASYPRNDWRIIINDSTNGGASYFGVEDATDGRRVFSLEAGAPSHSLYVDDYGRVGFGTSTPVVEAHIKDSDTPTVRLEQDGSSGWTAQTWDVAGNESNFFIRDATNGSKLPFRIQPGAPSSSLSIKSDGKVGIGTWSPSGRLDVMNTTGSSHLLVVEDGGNVGIGTSAPGAKLDVFDGTQSTQLTGNNLHFTRSTGPGYIWATSSGGYISLGTNGRTRSNANANLVLKANQDSYFNGDVGIGTSSPGYLLHVDGSAGKPGGGSWTDSSDARLKEDIHPIDGRQALDLLSQLQGVTFEWINPEEHSTGTRAGLVAQDVEKVFPNWVEEVEAQGSDAALVPEGEMAKAIHFPHDYNAYVIEAVKALDAENHVLAETVAEQDAKIAALQQQNADLEARLTALEEAAGVTSSRSYTLPLSGLLLGGLLVVGVVANQRRKE